jgi:hypothetical protein
MKYLLMIQLFMYPAYSEVPNITERVESFDSREVCEVQLQSRMDEWKGIYGSSINAGIVAICVEL